MPRFGWYGDDFTGATDTLATVAQAGLRSLLFLGVPTAAQLAAAGPLDAIGIAGAARSLPVGDMAAELEPVGRFFAGFGVPVLHYKCCSTFDSAPGIGSIGEAIRTLRPFFPNAFVPVVGGQPNIGRYCLFGNIFAAAGTGGTVHRLDRHPTMAVHPVTPMEEADLRRHLAAQGLPGIATVTYLDYAAGAARLNAAVDQAIIAGAPAVLLDVSCPADLVSIGDLLRSRAEVQPLLAVGPSGVVQALLSGGTPPQTTMLDTWHAPVGPVLVLAGSLSPITRHQVQTSPSYTVLESELESFLDPVCAPTLQDRVSGLLRAGRSVIVQTADRTAGGADPDLAPATARFLSKLLRSCSLRRVGIAGGDTASHAALALGLWGLSYKATLAPGVTLCTARSEIEAVDGLELMMKGGQMGPPNMFERLLHGCPTEDAAHLA